MHLKNNDITWEKLILLHDTVKHKSNNVELYDNRFSRLMYAYTCFIDLPIDQTVGPIC